MLPFGETDCHNVSGILAEIVQGQAADSVLAAKRDRSQFFGQSSRSVFGSNCGRYHFSRKPRASVVHSGQLLGSFRCVFHRGCVTCSSWFSNIGVGQPIANRGGDRLAFHRLSCFSPELC